MVVRSQLERDDVFEVYLLGLSQGVVGEKLGIDVDQGEERVDIPQNLG